MNASQWRSYTLPYIDGIRTRLDVAASAEARAELERLRRCALTAADAADMQHVDADLRALVDRDGNAFVAMESYLLSIMPPGVRPATTRGLIKKMLGDLRPRGI